MTKKATGRGICQSTQHAVTGRPVPHGPLTAAQESGLRQGTVYNPEITNGIDPFRGISEGLSQDAIDYHNDRADDIWNHAIRHAGI